MTQAGQPGRELTIGQQVGLITWVWNQQPESSAGWLWMGWMDRGSDGQKVAWRDRWFQRPTDCGTEGEDADLRSAIQEFLDSRVDKDIYFSPTVYGRRSRTKAAALPSRVIHADYDAVDPREFATPLVPQVVWETSPGSWQGLHVLREPLALGEWERLSARVTRGLGADKGCWDMPHPIRVPGRRNHKPKHVAQYGADGAPGLLVRLRKGEAIDWTESAEWLALPDADEVEAFAPEILLPMSSGVEVQALVGRLPSAVRGMLRDARDDGDRSEHVHATAKELLKAGLSADEASSVLAAESRAFQGKFSGRRGGSGGQVRREIEAALRSLTAEGWTRREDGSGGGLQEPLPDVELLASLTDWGNAARLVSAHGTRIRYVDQWMGWMIWDAEERRWVRDTGRRVRAMAAQLAKGAIQRAADEEDSGKRKALLRHNSGALSAASTTACLTQAQSFPGIVVQAEDLDGIGLAETWVDSRGWCIDLRTGEKRRAEPTDLVSKRGGISVGDTPGAGGADGATPARWLGFLTETFGGGEERLRLIQRLVGSSMVGTAKKWFVVLQGPTDSGKSQIQHVLNRVFGDYSGSVKRDTFAYSRWEKSNQDGLAALVGARFAMWSETKEGMRVDEALLKDLTDGVGLPKMVSRKYEKAFPMVPQMTLWMDTNHKPNLRAGDDALWNRVVILHTLRSVPKSEQVEGLAESIITEEGGAILRWALEGARAWLAEGGGKKALGLSVQDESLVSGWREDQDHLGRWLESMVVIGYPLTLERAVSRAALLEAWNTELGESWTPNRLNRELEKRQYTTGPLRTDDRKWKDADGKYVRTIPGIRWQEGVRE